MKIKLADSYGFCFGVKRAIKIAEDSKNATTIGPLIHNSKEINRLNRNFNVKTANSFEEIGDTKRAIIRTHGIPKNDLKELSKRDIEIINATCPFVTKPQQICEEMYQKGYSVVIFGDENHPEVKGVKSYTDNKAIVILDTKELEGVNLGSRVALVSQTTRKVSQFLEIANYLITRVKEVRVFNTICNATFENQDSAKNLASEADVMVVIGGKNSSNTKQLYYICQKECKDSYHIEDEIELKKEWFKNKKLCGVTAGASTPDWVIQNVIKRIEEIKREN